MARGDVTTPTVMRKDYIDTTRCIDLHLVSLSFVPLDQNFAYLDPAQHAPVNEEPPD